MVHPPPTPTLFPYTTLFRSQIPPALVGDVDQHHRQDRKQCDQEQHDDVAPIEDDVANAIHLVAIERADALERLHVGLRSEEHTSELQSLRHLVCRLLLEKKN